MDAPSVGERLERCLVVIVIVVGCGKRMKQKSFTERTSGFSNLHRKWLPFLLVMHDLVGIDQSRPACSVKG